VSRRNRILLLASVVLVALFVVVPSALAVTHDGEGIYGPTDDKQITDAMFIVIAFFPTVIVVFSLIQAWLDHRKHARLDAEKRRASAVEWKGGW
jgi:ABC-type sulfate transport system permease component